MLLGTALLLGTSLQGAQSSPPGTGDAARVDARVRALERDAESLAAQARSVLVDLQALEVERDLRREQAAQADAAARQAIVNLRGASQRVSDLEQRRLAELPSLERQLVELYKNGRGGPVRVLLDARDTTTFARMARMVAAIGAVNEHRLADHRRTMEALRTERVRLEADVKTLQAADTRARHARAAAERAVGARAALMADIDARRDLAAQYVGELRAAYARLQQQIAGLANGATATGPIVPLAPFKGALEWPTAGEISSPFGEDGGRLGGTAARNGIEIAAPVEGAVRAVHGGVVGFADVFPAFGRLVILEHGGNAYSLYGYLGEVLVTTGARVEVGAEIGHVGSAPAGPPALYFELRIDGQSIDPVQWLRPR